MMTLLGTIPTDQVVNALVVENVMDDRDWTKDELLFCLCCMCLWGSRWNTKIWYIMSSDKFPSWEDYQAGVSSTSSEIMAVFTLEDALSVWMNLGKHSLFVWFFVCSVKTGTRRIIRLYEQQKTVRIDGCVLCPSLHWRQVTRQKTNVCPSSSRRIMRRLE